MCKIDIFVNRFKTFPFGDVQREVLLNKVDAVSKEKVKETISAIRSVNQFAPVVECSLALQPDGVPVEELVSIEAFDTTKLLTAESRGGLKLHLEWAFCR